MDMKNDLAFAKVAAEQMDDYLKVETLYYPVGLALGLGADLPQLTIGNWLEVGWRLASVCKAAPTSEACGALALAQAEIKRVRSLAPDVYETKARREFKSRLDTWGLFVDEVAEKGDVSNAVYAAQVHHRLKLELLQQDVKLPSEMWVRLRGMDAALRRLFKNGLFIWEPELRAAAPRLEYWWLWGGLS
jgi:hypothetical protein